MPDITEFKPLKRAAIMSWLEQCFDVVDTGEVETQLDRALICCQKQAQAGEPVRFVLSVSDPTTGRPLGTFPIDRSFFR